MKTLSKALIILALFACTKPEPFTPDAIEQAQIKSAVINLIPNGGGENTGDWSGRPAWVIRSGRGQVETGSIYWAGNYMRIEARYQFVLISPGISVDTFREYQLTVKYQSSTPVKVAVMYGQSCTFVAGELPVSDKPSYAVIRFQSTGVKGIKFYNHPLRGGWLRMDEVELI